MVTLVVGSWMVMSVDGTVFTRSTLNLSADRISITRTTIITTTRIITVLALMLLILLGTPPLQLFILLRLLLPTILPTSTTDCYYCYYS